MLGSGQLSRIVLRGYKSIAECDLELGRLNVLIGGNGAGKSNFIGFFRLVYHQQGAVCVAHRILHGLDKHTRFRRLKRCYL